MIRKRLILPFFAVMVLIMGACVAEESPTATTTPTAAPSTTSDPAGSLTSAPDTISTATATPATTSDPADSPISAPDTISTATATPATTSEPADTPPRKEELEQVNFRFLISDERNAIGEFASLRVEIGSIGLQKGGEAGSWLVVNPAINEVDLVQLQGNNAQEIWSGAIPEGEYTKIFIHVNDVNGVLSNPGEPVEVKLPSGKLHILKGFEVYADAVTNFVYDITVTAAGNEKSGIKYLIRPVIGQSGTNQPINEVGPTVVAEPGQQLDITLEGVVEAGETISILVSQDGVPIEGATVEVNGAELDTTGADGRLSYQIPLDAQVLEVKVRLGELEGEIEVELGEPAPEPTLGATPGGGTGEVSIDLINCSNGGIAKWHKPVLTFDIIDVAGLGSEVVQAVRSGVIEWNKVQNVYSLQETTEGNADITIEVFLKLTPGFILGAASVNCVNEVEGIQGVGIDLGVKGLKLTGVRNLTAHEVGHGLGLDHADKEGDLMDPRFEKNEEGKRLVCPSNLDVGGLPAGTDPYTLPAPDWQELSCQ